MLQKFDTSPPTNRPSWMGLLARAPEHLLDAALAGHVGTPTQWLRNPETGLMMVQGRVGGTGQRFNLGEVTVTRCAMRLNTMATDAPVGVAYVLGRNHRQAQLAAMADALLQDLAQHASLEASLLTPLRAHLQAEQASRHARAQTTKVDFFTVAREASGDSDDSDADAL
jgi:alpha-D-ribose 1-methylphosphonate 5-triphosphate synthase subunit PhnG